MQAEKGEAIAKKIGGAFVKCDVSNEADGQAVVAKTVFMDKQMDMVNLVGSFNMIRLAADAMCKNASKATGERGVMISTASVAPPMYENTLDAVPQGAVHEPCRPVSAGGDWMPA